MPVWGRREKEKGAMERKERIIYFEHSVLALLMPLSHHDFCKVRSINVIIACKLFILACGPGLDVRGLVIELVSKVLQALQSMGARRESCTHGSTQSGACTHIGHQLYLPTVLPHQAGLSHFLFLRHNQILLSSFWSKAL